MVCVLLIGGILLVFAYNRLLNIERGVRAAREEFQKYQTENARRKVELLALFDSAHLATVAEQRSLVLEKKPAYVTVDAKWLFASGR